MFFEGSEKKAEIKIDNTKLSLLNDFDDNFWTALVNCSDAQILSSVANDQCKAFLLSESSLFVWDDHFLILTCGVTHLVKSVEYFIQQVGVVNIRQLTYQRKNEYFSHAQPSCFGDDIQLLAKYLPGKAYRFGEMDSHHNYIFHQDNDFIAATEDKTYGFLAYQISSDASKVLTTPNLSADKIRHFLMIDQLLPNFILDDFVFQPYGYSLNAIYEDKYLTIHVTPQADSSYVSFESNINLIEITPQILAILSPKSFDLLSFNELDFHEKIKKNIEHKYISKTLVTKKLSNGYFVCFANFILPQQVYNQPTELNISEENHAL